jgi:mono/diheme cytochrome c family protein
LRHEKETHMTRIALILAAAVLACPAVAEDVERGQDFYAGHCATCHGIAATGDGPMAPVLSVRPANLTLLSASNGGVFPTDRVIRRIDGTQEVLAHGGPMPLFGLLLEGPSDVIMAPDGSEIIASEAIVDIAAWLQSIQKGG